MTMRGLIAAPGAADSERVDAICDWAIRRAARMAPAGLARRLEEEWLADAAERRGRIPRLRFTLGCWWAVMVINLSQAPTAAPSGSPGRVTTAPAAARTPPESHRRPRSVRRPTVASAATAMCEINTTPLIDIMLVLLVTLLVSLPMMTHAVKIDLPQGNPANLPPPAVVDLDIDADGTVAWNGTAVADFGQLEAYLSAESRKEPQPEIHLRPDRRARYEVVAQVLAAAQRHHMQRIGFVNTGEFRP